MTFKIPDKPRLHKKRNRGHVQIPKLGADGVVVRSAAGTIKRETVYFAGEWGSVEMWDDFNAWRRRMIGELEADRSTLDQSARMPSKRGSATVADIVAAFMQELRRLRRFGKPDQKPADRAALTQAENSAMLLEGFADMRADNFTAQHLREARDVAIAIGNGRKTINGKMATIQRMFKMGVADRRCEVASYGRLLTLEKLGRLDRDVPKPRKVHAAPIADVEATIEMANPTIACMIKVQMFSGMRSENLAELSWDQIDQTRYDSDDVWFYEPTHHKNSHRGHGLDVVFGPEAITALLDYERMRPDAGHPFIFNPRATRCWRYFQEHLGPPARSWQDFFKASKKTDLNEHFSTKTYCDAVQRYQVAAGCKRWTPHQLRHLKNQRVVESEFGPLGAKAVLGHASARMTDNYSTQDIERAVKVQQQLG